MTHSGASTRDPRGPARDPLEEAADSFLARYRRGERPSIDEYVARYPHLAEGILALFPTLCIMEELGPRETPTSRPAGLEAERLGEYPIGTASGICRAGDRSWPGRSRATLPR